MVTVYEYLTQARKTGLRIQRLEARRHALLSSLLPAATVYDKPRVQSSPSDPMPEIMAEADELAEQIRDLERMRLRQIHEACDLIDTLESDEERTVLAKYFIGGEPMSRIAAELDYSISNVYRLRRIGMRALAERL